MRRSELLQLKVADIVRVESHCAVRENAGRCHFATMDGILTNFRAASDGCASGAFAASVTRRVFEGRIAHRRLQTKRVTRRSL